VAAAVMLRELDTIEALSLALAASYRGSFPI
jgi:hypothetical protein